MLIRKQAQTFTEVVVFTVLAVICMLIHSQMQAARLRVVDADLAENDYLQPVEKTSLEQPRHGEMHPLDTQGHWLQPRSVMVSGREVLQYPEPVGKYTYMAPGTDGRRRPANTYLVHYRPFVTDDPWVPWTVISERLKYAADYELVFWLGDAWQTSREAYRNMRGDCEDHAILLADWLIEMGYDARVAVGLWNFNEHAWVVVMDKGHEYLIEATEKRVNRKIPPLAMLKMEYAPRYMFNQDSFWMNKGNLFTTSYSSGQWQKVSQFVEDDR